MGEWTVVHKRAAMYLATKQYTKADVSRLLNIAPQTVGRWMQDSGFRDLVRQYERDTSTTVEQVLEDAEIRAAQLLMEAMEATDGRGKPDWKTRLPAIIRGLDMAGRRGKPVETTETKSLHLTGDLNQSLKKALAEPAVQELLATKVVRNEPVPLLPVEAEIVDDKPSPEPNPGPTSASPVSSGAGSEGPETVQPVGEEPSRVL